MKILICFVILLNLFLTSCASLGPSYSELKDELSKSTDNKARIIVIRTNEYWIYRTSSAPIKINGIKMASCPKGEFVYFDVTPEKQVLSTSTWDSPGECGLNISPEVGKNYFFEVMPRADNFGQGVLGNMLTGRSDYLGPGILWNMLAGIIGATIGRAIESSGKECGGLFALVPLEEEEALEKIKPLNNTK